MGYGEHLHLLYTVTGSFGIVVQVGTDRPFCVQRHIAILKNGCATLAEYARIALSAPHARAFAEGAATGTAQRTASLSALRGMPVPLPPQAEQRRIAARVGALMAPSTDWKPVCKRQGRTGRLRRCCGPPPRRLTQPARCRRRGRLRLPQRGIFQLLKDPPDENYTIINIPEVRYTETTEFLDFCEIWSFIDPIGA